MRGHNQNDRWLSMTFFLCLITAVAFSATRRIELTIREGTSMAVALSPDGERLAVDLLGSLWILPSEGGVAHRITDESSDARQPSWFPDGKTLAFQSFRYGSWDIVALSADGTNWRQLTHGPFDDREPQVSPDGKWVAFSSDRSGSYDIWTLNFRDRSTEAMDPPSRQRIHAQLVARRAPGLRFQPLARAGCRAHNRPRSDHPFTQHLGSHSGGRRGTSGSGTDFRRCAFFCPQFCERSLLEPGWEQSCV